MKEPWQFWVLVRDRRWVWSTGPGGVQAPAHLRLGSTKGPDSPGGYLSAPVDLAACLLQVRCGPKLAWPRMQVTSGVK